MKNISNKILTIILAAAITFSSLSIGATAMEKDAANITIDIAADEVSGESSEIIIDDVPGESEDIVTEEVPVESEDTVTGETPAESEDIVIDEVPVESEDIVLDEVSDEAQGIWSSSSGDESGAELSSTSASSSVGTANLDSADTTALDSADGSSIDADQAATSLKISKLTITGIADKKIPYNWDGKDQTPFAQKLTIKYKGKEVPAKGYKITASKVTGAGTGKVTVKGTGKAVTIKGRSYKITGSTTLSYTVEPAFKYSYGVFLGYEGKISKLRDYETVVIDVQSTCFTKKDIKAFKQQGHKVYSYINVGALENTRDYYKKYKGLALGKYEHWDEEVWIDVSKSKWQKFILKELAPMMLDKGIDGFFVDNCDVYYKYPRKKIYNGLTVIMKGLIATGKKVIINGGDCYLDKYCKKGGKWSDVITGINQESVFSAIDWDNDDFVTADPEDHEYFINYIEKYGNQGADIYLLEYTKDKKLISRIKKYCKKTGYDYYISGSLGLTFS